VDLSGLQVRELLSVVSIVRSFSTRVIGTLSADLNYSKPVEFHLFIMLQRCALQALSLEVFTTPSSEQDRVRTCTVTSSAPDQ